MAKNPPKWPGRVGPVTNRAQYHNPKTDLYVKKDMTTWKFIDNKTSWWKFKGVSDKTKGCVPPKPPKK